MSAKRCLGLMGLMASLVLCASLASAELKFSGYTQARYYVWDDDAGKNDAFDLRRVRIKAVADVSEDTDITLQLDFSELDESGNGEVVIKDAAIRHKLGESWFGTVGYGNMPFGLDAPYSSSKRLPLERARVTRWFLPGERALGALVDYKSQRPSEPGFTIGYTNGMADWYDDDAQGDADAFVARVQWDIKDRGLIGASYMRSSRTIEGTEAGGIHTAAAPGDYDDDVFGIHARYRVADPLTIQAEYFDGSILEQDLNGWYATLEYALKDTPTTLYYRYDTADYDAKADTYTGHTFGVAYDLTKHDRITAQVEVLDTETGSNQTNFGLQYQVKY